jgi:hypothetical protein
LYDLIERAIGQPLQLFVYNKDLDSVREVLIVPNEGAHIFAVKVCRVRLSKCLRLIHDAEWGGPGT